MAGCRVVCRRGWGELCPGGTMGTAGRLLSSSIIADFIMFYATSLRNRQQCPKAQTRGSEPSGRPRQDSFPVSPRKQGDPGPGSQQGAELRDSSVHLSLGGAVAGSDGLLRYVPAGRNPVGRRGPTGREFFPLPGNRRPDQRGAVELRERRQRLCRSSEDRAGIFLYPGRYADWNDGSTVSTDE